MTSSRHGQRHTKRWPVQNGLEGQRYAVRSRTDTASVQGNYKHCFAVKKLKNLNGCQPPGYLLRRHLTFSSHQ